MYHAPAPDPGDHAPAAAINNKLAPKPTPKPNPNPTLTLPLALPQL